MKKQQPAMRKPAAEQGTLELFLALVNSTRPPQREDFAPELWQDESFVALYDTLEDLRNLSTALGKGDLQAHATTRGYTISNLKGLQANLRNLAWLTRRVGEGDYTQRSEFLGDLSAAYNEMTGSLRDSRRALNSMANMDELTRIPNRRALETFLGDHFASCQERGEPFTILMLDIDHFKDINDKYGHVVGDQVLVQVCEILNGQFRKRDLFARFGGEEFVAGLPDTDLVKGALIAQRALEALQATPVSLPNGGTIYLTVSIGVAQMRESDLSHSSIVERSDKALYEAKKSGRNRVCVVE